MKAWSVVMAALVAMAALALVASGCGDAGGDACTPRCGDRACGPDPVCGSSCGDCAAGETCTPEGACALPEEGLAVCDGYAGLSSCCFTEDICGLAGDGQCDCDGACGWDAADCEATACRADGRCDAACDADPDCLAPCPCDHARGVCEAASACAADACGCDGDCDGDGGERPCAADDHCDPLCPSATDPDCAGSTDDGRFCCRPDCDGRACGDDGCGGSCGACAEGEGCFEGRCLVDECGGVGFLGCCDGDAPVWCEAGQLVQGACDAGQTCGWVDAETGYYCGGAGEAPDGDPPIACDYGPCTPDCDGRVCGSDGCGGSCGDCADGEVCSADGAACNRDECGGIGFLGCCEDGAPVWCEDGQLVQAECAAGEGCGWVDAETGYYCGGAGEAPDGDPPIACDGPSCTPDCAGKVCGDDGCGGDCGACADGAACVEGACVADCAPDCAGRECGDDGCGGDCGACAAGATCSAEGVCVAACGNVGYLGCCEGDTPVWCEEGELVEGACEAGETCGWVDAETGYYCGGAGEAPDGDPPIACDHGRKRSTGSR